MKNMYDVFMKPLLKKKMFITETYSLQSNFLSSLFCKLWTRGRCECKIIQHLLYSLKHSPILSHLVIAKGQTTDWNLKIPIHHNQIFLVTVFILGMRETIYIKNKNLFSAL